MKQTQILSSGVTIRQDFSDCVRFAFFETDFEGFEYATHGGTVFVVNFSGRVYALTCAHIFRDFATGKLFITEEKMGRRGGKPATIKGLCYPSSPRDSAVGTDITDVCV